MMLRIRPCFIATAVLFVLAGPALVRAEDNFYLLMFASQQIPRNPNYSHTFATFVRSRCNGPNGSEVLVEVKTISWLPANGIIRVGALLPECGRNFDLHSTIRLALATDQRVSLWGPYRIEADLYCRALKQIALLESGRVQYKANDAFYSNDRVSNCIHAVAGAPDGNRVRVFSPGWGDTASYFVLLQMMSWIPQPEQTQPCIGTALGLDCYPIAYRQAPSRPGFFPPLTGLRIADRNASPTFGPGR